MINQSTLNKDQSENDDKSKRFDSLIRAYNEKGLFPFSLDILQLPNWSEYLSSAKYV